MDALRQLVFPVAFVIGIARFTITPRLNLPTVEGSYEAFAHLFVGGLFGAWLFCKWDRSPSTIDLNRGDRFASACFWWAIGLSLLELAMFLLQKNGML
jgi:hypothetical protein